jgi:hypothetical protein
MKRKLFISERMGEGRVNEQKGDRRECYTVAVAAKRCKEYVHNAVQTTPTSQQRLPPDKLNKAKYKTSPIEREALNMRTNAGNTLIKNAISE